MIKTTFTWRGALGCRSGQERYATISVTVEKIRMDGIHAIRIVTLRSSQPEEEESLRHALQQDSHFLEAAATALMAFERNLSLC